MNAISILLTCLDNHAQECEAATFTLSTSTQKAAKAKCDNCNIHLGVLK